ncbi:ABC transporter permease [Sulfidibacter corallicola]|uniref:ABC transporter permease n=1 Tax=Sulfidibacter corallicola TaxID=2818388 RepID=A0A8A4TVZ8_SULCO|nr:ABC transporter permease [Sulfidibacter corallicola]QTD54119.1 ABC transporter permease [Sulfidibacter corallicola]
MTGNALQGLIRKEFRQHGTTMLLVLVLVQILAGLLLWMSISNRARGSHWQPFQVFLVVTPLTVTLLLGHRLVNSEFTAKTQLFLESLPVHRLSIFWVKWLLGFTALLATVAPTFLMYLWATWIYGEAMQEGLLSIIAVRSLVFLYFAYSLLYAFAFMGRYRIPGFFMIALSTLFISSTLDLDLSEKGPIALAMDSRFAFEAEVYPVDDLKLALGLGLLFQVLALVMSLAREGSVATMLAIKMSHREKIFMSGILLSTILLIALYDNKRPKAPYEMSESMVVQGDGVTIRVGQDPHLTESARQALADETHAELVALRDYLSLGPLPDIFITLRQDLDPDKFELGYLSHAEGFVVRMRYQPETWDSEPFFAWLIPELLDTYSQTRVYLERNFWLIDGFTQWWLLRDETEPDHLARVHLRAAYASHAFRGEETLARWISFREQLGTDMARAVAWVGVQELLDHSDPGALQAVFREKLGRPPERDFRAFFHELANPIGEVIFEHTDVDYGDLVARWSERLARSRTERAEALATIPRLEAELNARTLSEKTRRLAIRLRSPDDLSPETRVQLRYLRLPRYEWLIPPRDVRVEELPAPTALEWVDLPETYSVRTRFAWTVSLYVEALGCPIISGWRRMEVP